MWNLELKEDFLPGKYLFCQYSQLRVVGWRNIIHNNNCNHAKLLKEFASLSDLFSFSLHNFLFSSARIFLKSKKYFTNRQKANNKITILRPSEEWVEEEILRVLFIDCRTEMIQFRIWFIQGREKSSFFNCCWHLAINC